MELKALRDASEAKEYIPCWLDLRQLPPDGERTLVLALLFKTHRFVK